MEVLRSGVGDVFAFLDDNSLQINILPFPFPALRARQIVSCRGKCANVLVHERNVQFLQSE